MRIGLGTDSEVSSQSFYFGKQNYNISQLTDAILLHFILPDNLPEQAQMSHKWIPNFWPGKILQLMVERNVISHINEQFPNVIERNQQH